VTYNLLHGVPLRDLAAAHAKGRTQAGTSAGEGDAARANRGFPGRGRGRDGGAGSSDSGGRAAGDAAAAAQTASDAAHEGIAPTERHVWSPDVSDPADLVRSIEELMESGPIDVIALQEVDRFQDRTVGVDQARLVAETIGAKYWRFVPSVRGTPGIASEGAAWVPATDADDLPADQSEPETPTESGPRYGIALISRYPVRGWRVMRYPPAPVSMPLLAPTEGRPKAIRVPDEPRAVVAGIVELPYADVTVATAHLSFVPGVNTKQLNGLRAFVAGMPRPMILMGDFNTPGGIPSLVTGWDQVARVPTYPVMKPRVQFDHIMADGWTAEALEQARASARAVPLPVSDHCALLADFPEP
jgi:endonuclease/exonuclease/phosphatase family metal-dependent hydrolase